MIIDVEHAIVTRGFSTQVRPPLARGDTVSRYPTYLHSLRLSIAN